MKKWTYESEFNTVVDEDNNLVFNTNSLDCNDPQDLNSVVDNVCRIHNLGGKFQELDDYLMNEGLCTEEDREYILEEIANNTGFN